VSQKVKLQRLLSETTTARNYKGQYWCVPISSEASLNCQWVSNCSFYGSRLDLLSLFWQHSTRCVYVLFWHHMFSFVFLLLSRIHTLFLSKGHVGIPETVFLQYFELTFVITNSHHLNRQAKSTERLLITFQTVSKAFLLMI